MCFTPSNKCLKISTDVRYFENVSPLIRSTSKQFKKRFKFLTDSIGQITKFFFYIFLIKSLNIFKLLNLNNTYDTYGLIV